MKKIIYLILILSLVYVCRTKQDKIDRFMEGDVEIIQNHIEPYPVKGEATNLILEKEFTLDTERDDLAEIGLTDITNVFDIDSQGNIYIYIPTSDGDIYYKFNDKGNFVHSFGRQGQGPGENQACYYLALTSNDEIAVTDNNKLSLFKNSGDLSNETKLDDQFLAVHPLANGNYLVWKAIFDPTSEYYAQNPLLVCDPEFKEIAELDRQLVPNPMQGERYKGIWYTFSWQVADGKILTGFQDRGYEIFIYDFNGKLLRKIRKEYKSLPVSQEYKDSFMKPFSAPIFDDIRKKIYFPNSRPPFHHFFTDNSGRLFVMTYEKGEKPGEYWYDIFNPEGIFISRTTLNIKNDADRLYAKIKNNRLYTVQEKESGFVELAVYQIHWQ